MIARQDRVVYHLHGPYFFGAAAQLGGVLDRIADTPAAYVIDLSDVPMVDSSGARSFDRLGRKLHRRGGQLYLIGVRPDVRRDLQAQGLGEPWCGTCPILPRWMQPFPRRAETARFAAVPAIFLQKGENRAFAAPPGQTRHIHAAVKMQGIEIYRRIWR